MNFEQFVKNLICKVQLFIGNEYEIVERKVIKNNGVELTGLMAKKDGTNVFPTIYVDSMYDSKMSHEDVEYIAMKLARNLKNAEVEGDFKIDTFGEFEQVNVNIFFKLINAKRNGDLLQEIPHRRIHDLAVVYFYLVEDERFDGKGTILVRNEMMERWNITENDLYDVAMRNGKSKRKAELISMKDILNDMAGKEILTDEISMYVLSNESKIFGASVLIYDEYMKEVYDIIQNNFYILPSSIHELILIPDNNQISAQGLLEMVTSVNSTEVDEEEILADSVYYYDGEKDMLEWLI